MRRYLINEDKLPSRLPVVFSNVISKKIESICEYNQDNINGVTQFYNYIDGVKRYISNPVIAFDYTNSYIHFRNGAIFINDFGYNIAFITKVNEKTNKVYVYVFKIDFKIEKFGLKSPSLTESLNYIIENVLDDYLHNTNINESIGRHNKIIKQNDLRNIIKECIVRYMRN